MKKRFVVISIILIVIATVTFVIIKTNQNKNKEIKKFNYEYEKYFEKEVYGTDVTTLINKAIDNNEKYNIQKDEDGLYIDDGKYCIKIELNMISVAKTYQMEQINKAGIIDFIKNFNLVTFECNKIEYHKQTGRISKIVLTQLER